jgi:hypothetical protein
VPEEWVDLIINVATRNGLRCVEYAPGSMRIAKTVASKLRCDNTKTTYTLLDQDKEQRHELHRLAQALGQTTLSFVPGEAPSPKKKSKKKSQNDIRKSIIINRGDDSVAQNDAVAPSLIQQMLGKFQRRSVNMYVFLACVRAFVTNSTVPPQPQHAVPGRSGGHVSQDLSQSQRVLRH